MLDFNFAFVFSSMLTSCITTAWYQLES